MSLPRDESTRLLSGDAALPPPKTLILAGAGLVSGSWPVVDESLGTDKDGPTSVEILSWGVYRARMGYEISRRTDVDKTTPSYRAATLSIDDLHKVRCLVSASFVKASEAGKLTFVPKAIPAIVAEATSHDDHAIVTSNWDCTLHREFLKSRILQIHGSMHYPVSMLFPTELAIEGYRSMAGEPLEESRRAHLDLYNAHTHCIRWLKECREIILWGMALRDYDAELAVLIAETCKPKVKAGPMKLSVIDPDRAPAVKLATLAGRDVAHLWNHTGT